MHADGVCDVADAERVRWRRGVRATGAQRLHERDHFFLHARTHTHAHKIYCSRQWRLWRSKHRWRRQRRCMGMRVAPRRLRIVVLLLMLLMLLWWCTGRCWCVRLTVLRVVLVLLLELSPVAASAAASTAAPTSAACSRCASHFQLRWLSFPAISDKRNMSGWNKVTSIL